jgi:glycosyltransferase involved in cell wall biosynthesis
LWVINRGSIRLPAGRAFSAPLPGSEVVAVNVARGMAARGVGVTYIGHGGDVAVAPGVRFRPLNALTEISAGAGDAVLWIRDYNAPDTLVGRVERARQVLLAEDSIRDLMAIFRCSIPDLLRWVPSRLSRFDRVVFASRWQRRSWSDELSWAPPQSTVIYNLVSHMAWRDTVPRRDLKRLVNTSHPRKSLAVLAQVAPRLAAGCSITCSAGPGLYQDVDCRIIAPTGNGGWSDQGSFRDFAGRCGPAIRFVAPVNVERMDSFLDDFGAMVHPDCTEEVGATSVIEALTRGVVPVVSRSGALPEIVGPAGVVVPGRPGTVEFAQACADTVAGLSRRLADLVDGRRQVMATLAPGRLLDQWWTVLFGR